MSRLSRNAEARVYGRLEDIAVQSGLPEKYIIQEYFDRRAIEKRLYGAKYRDRESHLIVFAYRATEKYILGK